MTVYDENDPTLLVIRQGKTLRRRYTYEDSAGTPISLLDWAIRMQVRDKPGGTVMLEASDATGEFVIHPGGVVGRLDLRVGADRTAGVTKNGFYDIELIRRTDPTEIRELISGRAPLIKEITA